MNPIWSKMTVVAALVALLLAGCGGGMSRNELAQYEDMPESAQRGRLNASDDIDSRRSPWLHETRPAWTR